MKRDVSPSGSFFSVFGIAGTALTDGQGKITDRWSGFDGEENLGKKLTKLMKRSHRPWGGQVQGLPNPGWD